MDASWKPQTKTVLELAGRSVTQVTSSKGATKPIKKDEHCIAEMARTKFTACHTKA